MEGIGQQDFLLCQLPDRNVFMIGSRNLRLAFRIEQGCIQLVYLPREREAKSEIQWNVLHKYTGLLYLQMLTHIFLNFIRLPGQLQADSRQAPAFFQQLLHNAPEIHFIIQQGFIHSNIRIGNGIRQCI